MKEIWKDIYFKDLINNKIYDYRGLYQVSNTGFVKSLNYNKTNKEKILKERANNKGYYRVSLCKNGITKDFQIHRLVAYMFLPNDDQINKTFINHKDENPLNNNVENLEWCTQKYNCNYNNHNKKLSESHKKEKNPFYGQNHTEETKKKMRKSAHKRKIIAISLIENKVIIFNKMSDVKYYGFWNSAVYKCCIGKQKSHNGFKFYYLKK